MKRKPTLFLICGLPGAGKTTLAKRIARDRHALRLTPDEWIANLLSPDWDREELDRLRSPVEMLSGRSPHDPSLWGSTLSSIGDSGVVGNGMNFVLAGRPLELEWRSAISTFPERSYWNGSVLATLIFNGECSRFRRPNPTCGRPPSSHLRQRNSESPRHNDSRGENDQFCDMPQN